MRTRKTAKRGPARFSRLIGVMLVMYVTEAGAAAEPGTSPIVSEDVLEAMRDEGRVQVIVQLAEPTRPEGVLATTSAVGSQRRAIAAVQRALLGELAGTRYRARRKFKTIPFLALEVEADALDALARSARVESVQPNHFATPHLAESVPLVGANQAWTAGFDGSGWALAVLDTGLDRYHPFLAGKVVAEACFSQSKDCPDEDRSQVGPGAAIPCAAEGCRHGTHVAGIAAGAGSLGPRVGDDFVFRARVCRDACGEAFGACSALGKRKAQRCKRDMFERCRFNGPGVCRTDPIPGATPSSSGGVAKGAQLIAVQVFSISHSRRECRHMEEFPCEGAWEADELAALEHVYGLRNSFHIAAVNMSLGGEAYRTQEGCDQAHAGMKQIIDNLRSVGIATVVSAGNGSETDGIDEPGCISSAISVGSTTKDGTVADYSNSASFLTLLAPGSHITSSIPGGLFASYSGTSMAAPHVAGALAVLRQKAPSASVDEIVNALRSTGRPVADPRNGVTTPLIEIATALTALHDQSTTTTTTTTSTVPPCPADHPVYCGTLGCCAADHPVCGGDGRCHPAPVD